jgi:hypothetical protein
VANFDWMGTFLSLLPMIVLIGVWIYFMGRWRRGGFQSKYQTEYMAQMKAQVAVLERIAAALEKRD